MSEQSSTSGVTVTPPSGITLKWSPNPNACEHPHFIEGVIRATARPTDHASPPVSVDTPARWCGRCGQVFGDQSVTMPIDPGRSWQFSRERIANPPAPTGNRKTRRAATRHANGHRSYP